MANTKVRFTEKNSRNYLHLIDHSLFSDTFCVIDTVNSTMERLMTNAGLTAEIDKEFFKHGSPYKMVFIKCRRRDANRFRTEIFPKLHHKIAHKMGNDYLNTCELVFNTLAGENTEC